jgi:C4-dicarboxylate-specific signal transduction histidine kinase
VFSDFTEVVKAEKKIKDLNQELEEKVNRRTLELQNLNEELEQTNEELSATNDYLENTLKVLTETQNQLVESEKMSTIGNLVAGIAHEINTPLGVSITLSSHIESNLIKYKKLYDNDEMTYEDLDEYFDTASKSINMIMFNLRRVSNLVKSFKRISVDQSIQNKRLFNVKEYIDDVLLSLNSTLKKTKHSVIFNCDDNIKINSYPDAFFQIITNLVNNSLMHAFKDTDRGEIRIDIERKENKLMIIYKDNGIGIKRNELDKIFEPFYTTKRNKGGTGLGLNIVNNIVNQKLKGKIICHSEYSKGTTFKIIVPLGGDEIFNDKQ